MSKFMKLLLTLIFILIIEIILIYLAYMKKSTPNTLDINNYNAKISDEHKSTKILNCTL